MTDHRIDPAINVNAHKPSLDNLTPAQIRVVAEQLLYTMDHVQRLKFKSSFPGIYRLVCDND